MGYAGGEAPDPTYHRIGDHTEVFQVDFDPVVLPFEDLLQLVWQSHDPFRGPWKTQYASLVLAHDEEQLEMARRSAEQLETLFGKQVRTRIEPLKRFYLAEDYHQKYYLQNENALNREFRQMYPRFVDFLDSTAVARANSYLYGGGTCARLEGELPSFGLSAEAGSRLLERCR